MFLFPHEIFWKMDEVFAKPDLTEVAYLSVKCFSLELYFFKKQLILSICPICWFEYQKYLLQKI